MGRQLRVEYPGAFYHVTARGNERKEIFKSDRDRDRFLSYLESAVVRYGAVIHAWCLMNNHYHILVETPLGNLSQVMQHINGAYTNYFNTKWKRSGHLFQGRYKAIVIDADDYALELSRYIHLNPVRCSSVSDPSMHRWSSFLDYIGVRKAPEWLTKRFILDYFGKPEAAAPGKYAKFVGEMAGKVQENPLKVAVASTILGSPEFVAAIQEQYVDVELPDRNLPALRKLSGKPEIEQIIKTVEKVVGSGKKRLAKKVALYISHKYSGRKLNEIAPHFAIKESAVTQSTRRFEEAIKDDREIADILNTLQKELKL